MCINNYAKVCSMYSVPLQVWQNRDTIGICEWNISYPDFNIHCVRSGPATVSQSAASKCRADNLSSSDFPA